LRGSGPGREEDLLQGEAGLQGRGRGRGSWIVDGKQTSRSPECDGFDCVRDTTIWHFFLKKASRDRPVNPARLA